MLTISLQNHNFLRPVICMLPWVILRVLVNFPKNVPKGQDDGPKVLPNPLNICYSSLHRIYQLTTKYQALCKTCLEWKYNTVPISKDPTSLLQGSSKQITRISGKTCEKFA